MTYAAEKNSARSVAAPRTQSVSTTKQENLNTIKLVLATIIGLSALMAATGVAINGFLYVMKWIVVNIGSNPFGWVM